MYYTDIFYYKHNQRTSKKNDQLVLIGYPPCKYINN